MNNFRMRYKRIGYIRWRCRTASRRAIRPTSPVPVGVLRAPVSAFWRQVMTDIEPLAPVAVVLRVGEFVIGEEGDSQLSGHPDIIY